MIFQGCHIHHKSCVEIVQLHDINGKDPTRVVSGMSDGKHDGDVGRNNVKVVFWNLIRLSRLYICEGESWTDKRVLLHCSF